MFADQPQIRFWDLQTKRGPWRFLRIKPKFVFKTCGPTTDHENFSGPSQDSYLRLRDWGRAKQEPWKFLRTNLRFVFKTYRPSTIILCSGLSQWVSKTNLGLVRRNSHGPCLICKILLGPCWPACYLVQSARISRNCWTAEFPWSVSVRWSVF